MRKKNFIIMLALILLLLVACNNNDEPIHGKDNAEKIENEVDAKNGLEHMENVEGEEKADSQKKTDWKDDETQGEMAYSTENPLPTATPQPTKAPMKISVQVENGKFDVGNICVLGEFKKSDSDTEVPIEWIVVKKNGNKVLLLSRKTLLRKSFNNDINLRTYKQWDNCDLRAWLNGEFFYESFNLKEKELIEYSEVGEYKVTLGGKLETTNDYIFCLSKQEYNEIRTVKGVSIDLPWWLRTTAMEEMGSGSFITYVHNGLKTNGQRSYTECGIRPAMWMDISNVTPVLWNVPVEEEPKANVEVKNVGDIVTYGTYMKERGGNAEAIEWIVIDKQEDKALLLSKNIIDINKYHMDREAVTWEESSLRAWLNSDFYRQAFSEAERKQMILATNDNPDNPIKNTEGGKTTNDVVFCLSIEEAKEYLNETTLPAIATNYVESKTTWKKAYEVWWLRSPGGYDDSAVVVDSGQINEEVGYSVTQEIGVRPAIWIKLD